MNQTKGQDVSQVMYLTRWVSRNNFRAFVYNETEQKLANSYDEYTSLIESGLWFSQKEDVGKEVVQPKPSRKAKHGANS